LYYALYLAGPYIFGKMFSSQSVPAHPLSAPLSTPTAQWVIPLAAAAWPPQTARTEKDPPTFEVDHAFAFSLDPAAKT
jgi:hypothetical protein